MFKKIGCMLPLLAILLFLTYISIKQGYNTIFHENWSENYSDTKAVVVDIVVDSSYSSDGGGFGSWKFSFNPIVEYKNNGKTVIDTIVFLTSYEESEWIPGDSLVLNVNEFDGNLSKDIETDKNATGIVNIIMGLVFLGLSFLIVRSFLKARKKKEEEAKE